MSDKKPHYIPHPLCQSDPKVSRNDLENIDTYIRESSEPRWAACHLVRAIAMGLLTADPKVHYALCDIADKLASRTIHDEPKDPVDLPDPLTYLGY
jgi:hypothetical protein